MRLVRDARLHPERAAVQRDSFHVKCSQLSSLCAVLHGSGSRLPLDTIPAMHIFETSRHGRSPYAVSSRACSHFHSCSPVSTSHQSSS